MNSEIETILSANGYDPSALIQILSDIQDYYSFLPFEALEYISRKLHVPLSKIYGVITFYAFFRLDPPAKYNISVCLGTACHVAGNQRNLEHIKSKLNINDRTSPDGRYQVQTVACIGACALAPTIVINDKVYGRNTIKSIDKILKELK